MKPLNKEKALALFEDNAILFGNNDAIPEETVVKLFGREAVEHAYTLETEAGDMCQAYGAGGHTVHYLTRKGFLAACSYYNVATLREDTEEPESQTEEEQIEESFIRAIVDMFLSYMDEVAEAGDIVDTDEDNALLLAELERVTRAKRDGLLAKLFLAFAHGFDTAIKTISTGLDVERANE